MIKRELDDNGFALQLVTMLVIIVLGIVSLGVIFVAGGGNPFRAKKYVKVDVELEGGIGWDGLGLYIKRVDTTFEEHYIEFSQLSWDPTDLETNVMIKLVEQLENGEKREVGTFEKEISPGVLDGWKGKVTETMGPFDEDATGYIITVQTFDDNGQKIDQDKRSGEIP